jgi:hypothetical protein
MRECGGKSTSGEPQCGALAPGHLETLLGAEQGVAPHNVLALGLFEREKVRKPESRPDIEIFATGDGAGCGRARACAVPLPPVRERIVAMWSRPQLA